MSSNKLGDVMLVLIKHARTRLFICGTVQTGLDIALALGNTPRPTLGNAFQVS